jgi:predicted nucleic acid-binding protein
VALREGLLDTSIFIASESGRAMEEGLLPSEVVVSVVTVAELRAGVLVAEEAGPRGRRLATLTLALSFESIPIDDDVAEAWARLRVMLRSLEKRMPVNDSWIAATAMALQIPVVTQDDDYIAMPGLDVIRV